MRILFCTLLCFIYNNIISAQKDFYKNYTFTKADTLRGQLNEFRSCYDVYFYDLDIKVDVAEQRISGSNKIYFTAVKDFEKMQLDLYENMAINRILMNGKKLSFERLGNAFFVDLPRQKEGVQSMLQVFYEGEPIVAINPPWNGGFAWRKDENDNDWVGVACEGDGASLWWPNKDHLSEEPDSMSIKVAVPDDLMCVANGNLRHQEKLGNGYTRYDWFVQYPINNYNVTVNIGDYVHFSDTYTAQDGATLPLDYYVLSYNEEKARKHFKQVNGVLECFEHYFGKYPFWEDGFALVETSYLGMEHQGAIAYGNDYMRGYKGGMIPPDMDWDYIIVHETGHEYWGNSISANDLAQMWIHESFTTYMEALYVECEYSYEDAIRYLDGQRDMIRNEEPILGPADVNWENWSGSDHYFKGAWVLHTLRHAIGDDELWFDILKSFYEANAISNVETESWIAYVNERTGKDYSDFFEQYLWYPSPPKLLYRLEETDKGLKFSYRWEAGVDGFDMPILVGEPGNYKRVYPVTTQKKETLFEDIDLWDFEIAEELFLINLYNVR